MTAGKRLRLALTTLALGLAAAPAAAQNQAAPAPAPSAPAPSDEVIGPPQIQNFSLEGTVTRRAETPPVQQQPRRTEPATARTAPAAPASESPAPRQQAERAPEPSPPPVREPVETASSAPSPGIADLSAFGAAPTAAEPAGYAPALPPPSTPAADFSDDSSSLPPLPWLLAFLAAAGAAGWYFLRQRQRPRLAYAAGAELAEPEPRPEPLKRAPVPTRAPAPAPEPAPVPQGIVSTRLRPWLDIAVAPQSCRLADDGATVEFEVTVVNSGNAPARDVLVEAIMINADPAQDKQIGGFFAQPGGKGERIAAIPPLKSMTMRSAVSMPRDRMQQFEAEGRKLFVPVLAFNALYRNGSSDAQTSAAFLVGRNGKGDKMAPFVDAGPRQFAGLAARTLEPSVRR